jgi:putative ABC transport system permease protein
LISFSPTGVYSNDDGYDWDGKSYNTNPIVWRFCTDTDFLKTFEGEMAQGEFYKKELMSGSSDVSGKIIINETFAEIMGMENPVGARLSLDSNHFTISGIVKDFNFRLLYESIEPMAIYYQTENSQKSPLRYRYMFMKIEQENIQQTNEHVKKVYEKFSPSYPFSYGFLTDDYDQLYGSEQRLAAIIKYCTILTIMISCLGLFGLASFMTAQRTKEIGVRKVLGASVPGIAILLSKQFTKWVLIANIIAWPAAYLFMKNWLLDFAYRINLGWHIFVLSAILVLVIALITVSYQSIKAALANPVESLRYE